MVRAELGNSGYEVNHISIEQHPKPVHLLLKKNMNSEVSKRMLEGMNQIKFTGLEVNITNESIPQATDQGNFTTIFDLISFKMRVTSFNFGYKHISWYVLVYHLVSPYVTLCLFLMRKSKSESESDVITHFFNLCLLMFAYVILCLLMSPCVCFQ